MYFKRSILFRLKSSKNKAGEKKIAIRASWCGNRLEIDTPHAISSDQWDKRRYKAKGKANALGVSVSVINKDLDHLALCMQDAFNQFEFVDKRPPTKEELLALFNDLAGRQTAKEIGGEAFITINEAVTRLMNDSNNWTEGTRRKYVTIANHLKASIGDTMLEEVTEDTINSFQRYLLALNLRSATVERMVNRLKTCLAYAHRRGWYSGTAHQTYKVRVKGANTKTVVVLTPEELKKLIAYQIPSGKTYLERVRDLLVFACYTGLRYSDIQQLTEANIVEGAIELVTIKTTDILRIELNTTALQIIDKYKGQRQGGKLLPTISNQKANDYLKELGELAGIDTPTEIVYFDSQGRHTEVKPKFELMTTHIGRRTFISNALSVGIPVPTVMSWTGHKNYKAMTPYIKLLEQSKRSDMAKLDTLI